MLFGRVDREGVKEKTMRGGDSEEKTREEGGVEKKTRKGGKKTRKRWGCRQ